MASATHWLRKYGNIYAEVNVSYGCIKDVKQRDLYPRHVRSFFLYYVSSARKCVNLWMSSTRAAMNTFDECDLFDKAMQLSVIAYDDDDDDDESFLMKKL